MKVVSQPHESFYGSVTLSELQLCAKLLLRLTRSLSDWMIITSGFWERPARSFVKVPENTRADSSEQP